MIAGCSQRRALRRPCQRLGREHAAIVKGVTRVDVCRGVPALPNGAQERDRLWQSVLLAVEPCDKPPASYLPARFERPQFTYEFPPRHRHALAVDRLAEHHARAPEQLPRHELRGRVHRVAP